MQMKNLTTNHEQFKRVVPLTIGILYVIQFPMLTIKNPGPDQLKEDLQRCRSTKQVLKQLFIEGQNYEV